MEKIARPDQNLQRIIYNSIGFIKRITLFKFSYRKSNNYW